MADTSAKFGFPYIGGEAQADVTHNEFVNMVQALLQGVEDRGIDTPPGGPSDGDSYIMGSSPTGAWAGRANGIAFYDDASAAWIFFPGDDDAGSPIVMAAAHTGVRVYVKDEAVSYVWQGDASPPSWVVDSSTVAVEEEGASALATASTLNFVGPNATATDAGGGQADITIADDYDFKFEFQAAPSSPTVYRVAILRDITIPAGFAGSVGSVDTNPDATFTVLIKDDGATVGTITVSTGGSVTITDGASPAAAVNIDAGSFVTFEPQYASPVEATIAGLVIGIKASAR